MITSSQVDWVERGAQKFNTRAVEYSVPATFSEYTSLDEVLQTTRCVNIAWVGVGDLALRFVSKAFRDLINLTPELRSRLNVTCVDVAGYTDSGLASPDGNIEDSAISNRLNLLKWQGFPLSRYFHVDDFKNRLSNGLEDVDIIYLALPPALHYKEAKEYISLTPEKTIIAIEKPIARPQELQDMIQLCTDHPGRIIDVDFFTTSTAFNYLMREPHGMALLTQVGTPHIINAHLLETQKVESHRLGGNDGLRRYEVSGGGMLLDCGVHCFALASVFIDTIDAFARTVRNGKADHGQNNWVLDKRHAYLASYDNRPELRETYGLMRISHGEYTIQVQAGKGVATNAYGMEILSRQGNRLSIGLGSEYHPPFLFLQKQCGVGELIVFECRGFSVGYDLALQRLLSYSANRNADIFPGAIEGLQSAVRGVQAASFANDQDIQHSEYKVGEMPPIFLDVDNNASGHVPAFNERER